ncbi:MAG: efflux RND transporter periplasmic adaptor subunit [Victivallales bacterium]|nr:efflux RND transporter periplasmic adaptor subunit [Victivallales bacterium]
MKRKIWGVIFILAGIALAVMIGWKLYLKLAADQQEDQSRKKFAAVPVEVGFVKRTNMHDIRNFTGTLNPWTIFRVAPKISGRLKQLTVAIGDPVNNGQLLARIDDEEYQQQLIQARAELKRAEAQLEESTTQLRFKEKELKRQAALFRRGIVAEADYDAADSEYKRQLADSHMREAQLLQQQAVLRTAEVRLNYTRIYAQWSEDDEVRYVGERFVDPGTMLNDNQALCSIIDIQRLKASIAVIERDYPRLEVGQPAWITADAFPGQRFAGRIARISKVLDERSRQAEVQVEIPNPELKLKPGMFVRVGVEFTQHPNAQVVPRNAVVERNGQTGVFRVDASARKAFFVPVTTGIATKDEIEIVAPEITAPIVTLGYHLLSNGSEVLLPDRVNQTEGEKTK